MGRPSWPPLSVYADNPNSKAGTKLYNGGDWTASVPTLEYPFLKRIYGFYKAADKVENIHLPNERHDYGPNKRLANYDFFIRVFHLDKSMLDESKVTILPVEALMSNLSTH